jgi:hypothetical protein
MARANNNGWDFVKVGKTYQYKEDWFIAVVKILEDLSDDEFYKFKIQVEKASSAPVQENGIFTVTHRKNLDGVYSGMIQFFESPEYMCNYTWHNKK